MLDLSSRTTIAISDEHNFIYNVDNRSVELQIQKVANMAAVLETHIELDERGVAWIAGANTKVIEVALDKTAQGWSPEEIHFQHPHLSMAQIYSALAYYYDHQAEIDAAIAEQVKEVRALAEQAKDTPGRRHLRELGRL